MATVISSVADTCRAAKRAARLLVQIDTDVKDAALEAVATALMQRVDQALKLAHRGYVMETGTITFSDRAEVLLKEPRIQAAYLGE